MSAVGTLVFCADCGNLLDRSPGSDKLVCEMCTAVVTGTILLPPAVHPPLSFVC